MVGFWIKFKAIDFAGWLRSPAGMGRSCPVAAAGQKHVLLSCVTWAEGFEGPHAKVPGCVVGRAGRRLFERQQVVHTVPRYGKRDSHSEPPIAHSLRFNRLIINLQSVDAACPGSLCRRGRRGGGGGVQPTAAPPGIINYHNNGNNNDHSSVPCCRGSGTC